MNIYEKQNRFKPMKASNLQLREKVVAVVGLGGLGSHSCEYLARMGVGTIILIDGDIVELSNLPRQGLYTRKDSQHLAFKVLAAKEKLKAINPDIFVLTYPEMLTADNIHLLLKGVDLILDGSDNMSTRYLINDYCFTHNIPWIYAAATSSIGVVSNFIPGKTPCLRCIYGDPQEDQTSCDINGIILPALTLITSFQVTEAIKILLGVEPILGELRYDIWTRKETIFDTSMLVNEECQCKTKQKPKDAPSKKYYMICSGDTVQVNTDLNKESMRNKFEAYRFSEVRENEMFIELEGQTDSRQKIIGYKTGKIIFHQMDKTDIQKMLS